jgi:hypothetical protein
MFGANFQALPRQAVAARATPPSGQSQEAIWHCLYDTQTFTSASSTRLLFFTSPAAGGDRTLSNMDVGGQLSSPQSLQIHNICLDAWPAVGVSTSATNAGNLNDLFLLLFIGRPMWTLTISSKAYGPYPLSTLHGTGGPSGNVGTAIATPGSMQFARNEPSTGWNYLGRIIIPEQVSFQIEVVWAATQTLTANWLLRMSLMGVLNRRVI